MFVRPVPHFTWAISLFIRRRITHDCRYPGRPNDTYVQVVHERASTQQATGNKQQRPTQEKVVYFSISPTLGSLTRRASSSKQCKRSPSLGGGRGQVAAGAMPSRLPWPEKPLRQLPRRVEHRHRWMSPELVAYHFLGTFQNYCNETEQEAICRHDIHESSRHGYLHILTTMATVNIHLSKEYPTRES